VMHQKAFLEVGVLRPAILQWGHPDSSYASQLQSLML
jgi:hypothetical protein